MDPGALMYRVKKMKLLIKVVAVLVISAIVISIAIVILGRNPVKLAQGELRCQVPSPNRNSCEYRFNDPKWPSASEEPVDPCQGTRRAKCEDKPRATILNGVGD